MDLIPDHKSIADPDRALAYAAVLEVAKYSSFDERDLVGEVLNIEVSPERDIWVRHCEMMPALPGWPRRGKGRFPAALPSS